MLNLTPCACFSNVYYNRCALYVVGENASFNTKETPKADKKRKRFFLFFVNNKVWSLLFCIAFRCLGIVSLKYLRYFVVFSVSHFVHCISETCKDALSHFELLCLTFNRPALISLLITLNWFVSYQHAKLSSGIYMSLSACHIWHTRVHNVLALIWIFFHFILRNLTYLVGSLPLLHFNFKFQSKCNFLYFSTTQFVSAVDFNLKTLFTNLITTPHNY